MHYKFDTVIVHGKFWLIASISLCMMGGCSQSVDPFDRKPTVKVKGKVLWKGQPASGAIVTFIQADGPDSEFPGAQGIVDEKGVYELTTYTTKDGIITGEYVVTVLWPTRSDWWNAEEEPSQLDKLKGKYAPGKSNIRRTVREGDEQVELIELE